MTPLALLLMGLVSGAPEILVTVAPDQPAPHIYTGEPLIIEFRADGACTVSAGVEIHPEFGGDPIVAELGDIRLQASSPHWCTIESVPDTRGRYLLTIRFNYPEELPARTFAFCRIDRPAADEVETVAPVCAAVGALTASQRVALKTAGVRTVSVEVAGEADYGKVDEALKAGFQVMVRLRGASTAVCESAGRQWHDRVSFWQIDWSGSAESFGAMAKGLRSGGTRSPIAAVVADGASLKALLDAGLGKAVDAVAVDPAASGEVLRGVRDAAAGCGYERMELHAWVSPPPEDGGGARLLRQGIDLVGSGASLLVIDSGLIAGENGLGEAFSYLNAVRSIFGDASYVAPLRVEGGATVHVFRGRDRWIAGVWCDSGEADAPIPVEGATLLELYDGRSNPLECPAPSNGAVVLRAGAEPVFLTGKGGPVLAQTAGDEARREAEAFCNSEEVNKYLAKEAVEVVRKVTGADGVKRLDFLNLLQMFPYLEKQWHEGPVPRSVVVPSLACLGRLVRLLCIVEHERGEAFVEPLQNVLSECGQFQSRYLTGTAGPDDGRERGDWLLGEVSRLMAEAESLSAEGRGIEASAVGAFAEWRAEALEISAEAEPLSGPEKLKPEPEVKKEEPEPAEPAKKTKKKTGAK